MSLAAPTIETDIGAETLITRKNSVGSEYVTFNATRHTVLSLACLPLEKAFRRVILDPVRGLVMLMTPSRKHEGLSEDIDNLIKAATNELSIKTRGLSSYRWRRPEQPPNTGLEADRCYYLGANAQAYLFAEASSSQEADNFVLQHPPDLVIEVGITSIDKSKQARYRELGVPEYWQVDQDTRAGEIITVKFLALEQLEPRVLTTSKAIPGLRSQDVEQALSVFRKRALSTSTEYQDAVRAILQQQKVDIAPA